MTKKTQPLDYARNLNRRTTELNCKCDCEFGILQHMSPGKTSNAGCVISCVDNRVLIGERGLEG